MLICLKPQFYSQSDLQFSRRQNSPAAPAIAENSLKKMLASLNILKQVPKMQKKENVLDTSANEPSVTA
jgi:hypothetical protein